MPVLRCTNRLLADIDDLPSPDFAHSTSPLGDWYGHIFAVERRKCVMFINEPTLFVCPAFGLVKAEYRDIAPFFREVLTWALRETLFFEDEVAWIVGLHKQLTVGHTVNRSTVASLNNRIAKAKATFQWQGGFGYCEVAALAVRLNQTPLKPIGYSNGYEQMRRLVDGCLKRTQSGGYPVLGEGRCAPRQQLPPCPQCGRPLRSAEAQQCFHCGADWHGKVARAE
jgi:hypothetical protein